MVDYKQEVFRSLVWSGGVRNRHPKHGYKLGIIDFDKKDGSAYTHKRIVIDAEPYLEKLIGEGYVKALDDKRSAFMLAGNPVSENGKLLWISPSGEKCVQPEEWKI